MPRPVKFPPSILSKRGYDYIRVCGVERHLGPAGSEQARARYVAACQEIQAHGGRLAGTPDRQAHSAPTVADALARWWRDHGLAHYQGSGEVRQFRYAMQPLERLFGQLPVKEFGAAHFEQLQQAMASGSWMTPLEQARRRKYGQPVDWCRRTVNRRCCRLRTVWRQLERWGLAPEGRWAALRAVPGLGVKSRGVRGSKRPASTPRGELDLVLPHCPPVVAAMLDLQWWAGMRSCEVRGVRTQDVDRGNQAITESCDSVIADVWAYRVRPEFDKNSWRGDHAQRVVMLGPECQRILTPWLRDDDPEGYVFRPQRGRRRKDGTFRSGQTCYTAAGYTGAVREACAKASEKAGRRVKIRPQGGRHATRDRVTKAAGLDAARAIMGHSTVEMSASYGTQVDLETAKNAARKTG